MNRKMAKESDGVGAPLTQDFHLNGREASFQPSTQVKRPETGNSVWGRGRIPTVTGTWQSLTRHRL